jgi:hypothetical protein
VFSLTKAEKFNVFLSLFVMMFFHQCIFVVVVGVGISSKFRLHLHVYQTSAEMHAQACELNFVVFATCMAAAASFHGERRWTRTAYENALFPLLAALDLRGLYKKHSFAHVFDAKS